MDEKISANGKTTMSFNNNNPYDSHYEQAKHVARDLNDDEFDSLNLDSLELDSIDFDANSHLTNPHFTDSRFYLKLFGSPRFYYFNQHVKLGTRKAMALLCYLAIRQTPVQRHELDALLWPEKNEKRARRSLRDEISRINKTRRCT